MIGSAGLTLMILAFWNGKGIASNMGNIDNISVGLFIIAIIILRKWKTNPIFIMIGTGVLGLCIYPFVL